MADKDEKAELIDAGATAAKPAEKAPVKEEPKKTFDSGASMTSSGLTEDRNEPHIHLAILLVIVIIIGAIIAVVKF
jgi:hypothetical protein